MSDTETQRKLLWAIGWLIMFGLTVTVGYPGDQSTVYFGWWPASNFQVMVVATLFILMYIPYMKDVMFNISPVDEDELVPLEDETTSSSVDPSQPSREVSN